VFAVKEDKIVVPEVFPVVKKPSSGEFIMVLTSIGVSGGIPTEPVKSLTVCDNQVFALGWLALALSTCSNVMS
jgi:hypothetical protein